MKKNCFEALGGMLSERLKYLTASKNIFFYKNRKNVQNNI